MSGIGDDPRHETSIDGVKRDGSSGDLRTRIAAVIAAAQAAFDKGDPYNGPEDSAILADAVIRELGLHRESMLDGIAPVDDPPAHHHRYVTECITDDKDES